MKWKVKIDNIRDKKKMRFQIQKIKTYAKENKECYLGNINLYSQRREKQFTKYEGQKIYDYQFEFIVPKKDNELKKLIEAWNKGWSVKTFEIYDKIKELNGLYFIWV